MRLGNRTHAADLAMADADIEALGTGRVVVRDAVLGPSAAASIRDACLELSRSGRLKAAGVGRDHTTDGSIRGDTTSWIDGEDDVRLRPVFALMTRLGRALNRTAYLGLRSFDMQLAVYDAQRGYTRHVDALRHGGRRTVTAIYYINHWRVGDGGELEVFAPDGDGSLLVAPVLDRLVVFLSDRVEHAVRSVDRGPRLALTAWFTRAAG